MRRSCAGRTRPLRQRSWRSRQAPRPPLRSTAIASTHAGRKKNFWPLPWAKAHRPVLRRQTRAKGQRRIQFHPPRRLALWETSQTLVDGIVHTSWRVAFGGQKIALSIALAERSASRRESPARPWVWPSHSAIVNSLSPSTQVILVHGA